jgi:hypothetical protein
MPSFGRPSPIVSGTNPRRPPIEPPAPTLVEQRRPALEEVEEAPPSSDPSSGSVEIPIMFSDTPLSGEQFPDADAVALAIEDQPTEMRERFPTSSDTDTTERRSDLGHLSMGKRPRVGNIARVPRASTTERGLNRAATTERGTRPTFEKSSDTEIDDNNATLIQPSSPIRRRPLKASPDDTIRMEGDATNDVRDARDRLTSTPETPLRTPKLPRR